MNRATRTLTRTGRKLRRKTAPGTGPKTPVLLRRTCGAWTTLGFLAVTARFDAERLSEPLLDGPVHLEPVDREAFLLRGFAVDQRLMPDTIPPKKTPKQKA